MTKEKLKQVFMELRRKPGETDDEWVRRIDTAASLLAAQLAEPEWPIPFGVRRSVLQPWVERLTFMQQSVLIAAVRGPDGIRKDHPAKVLCRWLRRCFMISAFDRQPRTDPYMPGGGSFTGPCEVEQFRYLMGEKEHALANAGNGLGAALNLYLRSVDELPHHFQLHFCHAAEILGYKHPDDWTRGGWYQTYLRLVNDMHLHTESEAEMDKRLGDYEADWRAREEVTAR